jgi:hypothetical protein
VSILTFDVTGTPIAVQCQRGGHAVPRQVGTIPTSHGGSRTSSIRAELMVVPVVLIDYSPAIVASIRTLFANGAQVACSGDVFNNGGATITCSATFADEFEPAGPWFGLSMTLYEVGTALGSSGTTSLIYLVNDASVEDPGDGSIDLAFVGPTPGGGLADLGTVRVLDAATLITCGLFPDPTLACGTVYSEEAERSWLTLPLAETRLYGDMTVTILSRGGGSDQFAQQGVMCKIYLVRDSVDVRQADTAWAASNGGFAGGTITMTTEDSILWSVEDGDKIRVEVWGRIALNSGYTDTNDGSNLARQTLTYGQSGTGVPSTLTVGGVVELL